jgi:O-antigen ligase
MKRLVFIGICGLLVLTSLLTQSRGGLMGLGVIVIMLVFRPMSPVRQKSNRWIIRAAVMGLLGLLVWTQLPSDAKDRFGTIFSLESDYNMDASNTTGRTDIWKRNLKATVTRPIGFGINTFTSVDLLTGGKYKAPHNSLVQITVELGFLGLFLFLWQYVLSWRCLRLKRYEPTDIIDNETRERTLLAMALQISLLANFVAGFFLSQAYSNLVWALFAVVAALVALEPRRTGDGAQDRKESAPRKRKVILSPRSS